MKCLNCENEYQGVFCNHCGQKASTRKITFLNILNDFFRLITNTDKGLFFNFINLTLKPRKTILDFIKGKRKNLFLPIQYVVLGLTLLTLADFYWGWKIDINSLEESNLLAKRANEGGYFYNVGVNIRKMLDGNIKYFLFSYIFVFALPAKLFYKRFTLPEHVVIQAFVVGHAAFFTLLLFLVYRTSPLLSPVFFGAIFIMTFSVFYKKSEIIENFISSFFVITIGIILFFILALMVYSVTNT